MVLNFKLIPCTILTNIEIFADLIASSKAKLSHVVETIVSENQDTTRLQDGVDIS